VGTSRPREPAAAGSELKERNRAVARPWLRSFGRRKGRKLSSRQSSLLATDLDRCRLDLDNEWDGEDLSRLFATPVRETWLEIGFGSGEHLIWQAENNPHVGLIGAEPYLNGVVAALSAIEAHGFGGRIRLHADDAMPLLDWLPTASISRAFLLFPDPWPKSRHRARRFLSPLSLGKLARVLRSGSELRFASDIADYAEAAIGSASAHPDFELGHTFTSANRGAMPDWPMTRYEAKANRAGRSSLFVVMRRRLGPQDESA
jgi:tRNA (guanine-N7-)-methyltransferase